MARHECPGARPFPSAPTQRLFLSFTTREVLIGGLPAGERDLTGVVIRRQQVLLLAGSVHPVHVQPSVDEALGPDCTQGFGTGVLRHAPDRGHARVHGRGAQPALPGQPCKQPRALPVAPQPPGMVSLL